MASSQKLKSLIHAAICIGKNALNLNKINPIVFCVFEVIKSKLKLSFPMQKDMNSLNLQFRLEWLDVRCQNYREVL
ncbi:hypothetical protein CAL7716_080730 [Calothrix sp. PCC 7716]|nr:hypothetical protein CAL7716_080730 [Calothrix sp. PCC 7716]